MVETMEKIKKVLEVIKTLRSENGCMWDRAQTHDSITGELLEESYELIDAINENDNHKIKDELGDVLLQVLMHSQMASEENIFDFNDVCENLSEKLIRRHPHVFDNLNVNDTDEILKNWEKIKVTEKGYTDRKSAIDGIPKSFTALMKAYKIGKKAAKVGFDWPVVDGAIEKLDEEIIEFKEAIATKDSKHIEEELGDVLFSICNIARKLDIQPEYTLNKTVDKFYNRFTLMEEEIKKDNKNINDLTLEEMDKYWKKIKLKIKEE